MTQKAIGPGPAVKQGRVGTVVGSALLGVLILAVAVFAFTMIIGFLGALLGVIR